MESLEAVAPNHQTYDDSKREKLIPML